MSIPPSFVLMSHHVGQKYTCTVKVIWPHTVSCDWKRCVHWHGSEIRISINHPFIWNITSFRMSRIRSEYSNWCVYMKHFYSDQPFIPNICRHVNIANVSWHPWRFAPHVCQQNKSLQWSLQKISCNSSPKKEWSSVYRPYLICDREASFRSIVCGKLKLRKDKSILFKKIILKQKFSWHKMYV